MKRRGEQKEESSVWRHYAALRRPAGIFSGSDSPWKVSKIPRREGGKQVETGTGSSSDRPAGTNGTPFRAPPERCQRQRGGFSPEEGGSSRTGLQERAQVGSLGRSEKKERGRWIRSAYSASRGAARLRSARLAQVRVFPEALGPLPPPPPCPGGLHATLLLP